MSDPTLPADAASPAPRRGSWLYTQAGDLDPLWLFLGAHLVLGLFLVLGALFYGQRAVLVQLRSLGQHEPAAGIGEFTQSIVLCGRHENALQKPSG